MPRLPDDSVLGGLPSANSGRAIATFDTSAPARAMGDLGQGIRNLGSGIAKGIEAYSENQSDLEIARAKSGYLTEKVALDEEQKNETDPEKLKAFPDRFAALGQKWGNTISNANKRERWNLDMSPRIAEDGVKARDRLFSVERDKYLAESNDQLETLRQIGVDPASTDADREMAIEVGQDIIRGLEGDRYLTAQQAQQRRQKWVRDYTWDTLRALPAPERIAALGGGNTPADVAKVYDGMTESGNADTLMELFRKTGGQVIDPRETAWCAAFVDAILGASGKARKGSLRAADFLNYGTPTDAPTKGDVVVFKPQAAGASGHVGFVVGVDDKGNVRYIAGNDSNKVQETTLPLSEVAGFRIPPEAGKSPLPQGADTDLGERVAKRATEASKSTRAASLAGYLAPDDQKSLLDQSRKEIAAQEKVAADQRKEMSAVVENDVEQDLRSMEVTGTGRDGLTREKVQAALGPKAAMEWEAERSRARQIYEAVGTGTELLTKDELDQRVNSLAPKGGEGDFKEREATYATARKKADAIISERESDPALAAERHPVLKQARQAAQYDGEGPARAMSPASAQSIVASRLKVQEQLGIFDPSPITRNEGAIIARQLRMIGEDNSAGLERLLRQLDTTYGDYAQLVLSSALVQERVNRDLANLSTDVLSAIVKQRAMPAPTQAAPLQSAIDNQRMTDAMSGRATEPPASMRDAFNTQAAQREGFMREMDNRNVQKEMASPPSVTYDPRDIRALDEGRNNPDTVVYFNAKYGKNAADVVLKDIDRRRNVKAR